MGWFSDAMDWGGTKAPTTMRDDAAIGGRVNDGFNNSFGAAPTIDQRQQAAFRNMQMQQAGQLQGIASGQQKGAGELAAQRQVQNALAGQQAMARMRGAGGAGMLAAGRQSAGIGVSGAGMAQRSALQDQQNAQALLTNALTQGRGADINIANANLGANLQQQQLNNQSYQAMLDALLRKNQAEMQAGALNARPGMGASLMSAGGQLLGGLLG